MTRLRPSALKELDDHPLRGAASFRNRFFMSLARGCSVSSLEFGIQRNRSGRWQVDVTRLRPSALKELDDHPARGAAPCRNRSDPLVTGFDLDALASSETDPDIGKSM